MDCLFKNWLSSPRGLIGCDCIHCFCTGLKPAVGCTPLLALGAKLPVLSCVRLKLLIAEVETDWPKRVEFPTGAVLVLVFID